MKNSTVAIIIPIYKTQLSINENISLFQCRKVLNKYDRYFIVPAGMDIEFVEDEKVIIVKKEYLVSRKRYSDYVLSEEFYALFNNYEYILIHQLDVFVFEDRLEYFCEKDFDYIGAEWVYGLECHTDEGMLWYFGNGGFSLRRVSSFLNWIRNEQDTIEYYKMLLPEDLVIAIHGRKHLKIAGREVAREFSFDMYPEECYQEAGKKLPFGCHAWHRFDREFWAKIIQSYGYNVEVSHEYDFDTKLLSSGKERTERLSQFFSKDKIESCLKNLLADYKDELYVFGAGQCGFSFVNMTKGTNVKVINVLDNDASKAGLHIEGVEIISVKEALKTKRAPILIAVLNPEPIENQLKEYGLKKNIDYIFSRDLQNEMCKC